MLPDRSILKGQKLVENVKIRFEKCDILGDFQTLCKQYQHLFFSLDTFLSLDFAQNVICKGDFIEGFEVSKKNYEVLKTDFC